MLIDLFPKGPKLWQFPAIVLIVGVLSACTHVSPIRNHGPQGPKVVATTTVLCDLTRQIAEKTVDLDCLMKPGIDPHGYEPNPGDRKAIEDADLVFYGGLDFEPSLIQLIEAASTSVAKIAVHPYTVSAPKVFEEQTIDPHVWHDAQKGMNMVDVIQRSLAEANPVHANLYTKNAQNLRNEISQINIWIKKQIATIPKANRTLVTTHDSLGYYAKAYDIPIEGALGGISTEEKPTSARMKALVKIVRASKVPTIFAERTINPKLIETVAKEAKVKVSDQALFTDGLGEVGSDGETYQNMLIANTKTIVEGLGGTYTSFQPKAK